MIYDLNAGMIETDDPVVLRARVRSLRNRLLSESDWTQLADVSVDSEAWATYRQELRDTLKTWKPGPTWTAPTPPDE